MTLNPNYPAVDGRHRLNGEWSMLLDRPYNRRAEEGALVIWRPGVTMWFSVWRNEAGEAVDAIAFRLAEGIPEAALDVEASITRGVRRIGYRIDEKSCEGGVYAFYGYVVGPLSHVQAAMHCDSPAGLDEARTVFLSIAAARP